MDYLDDFATGFHINLDDGTWVLVRREQVESRDIFRGGPLRQSTPKERAFCEDS